MPDQGSPFALTPHAAATTGAAISQRSGLRLVTLRGRPDRAWAVQVQQTLGMALPRQANTALQTNGASLLWLGPDAFLAVLDAEDVAAELMTNVQTAGSYALDISHSRLVLRLQGRRASTVLERSCLVDLHPRVFPVDSCAHTLLARMPLLIHRVSADDFDLYVLRSYARSMWAWLQDAPVIEEIGTWQ